MANIELQLITAMSEYGDYSPIVNGDITEDHFRSEEARMILGFIKAYRENEGQGIGFPSRATIEARFSSSKLTLPEISLADTVRQLAHEVRTHAFRSSLRAYAQEMLLASDSSDPRDDATKILSRLRAGVEGLSPVQAVSFAEALPRTVEAYKNGGLLAQGIDWPWKTMTEATRGIHKQELVIIAGRPKMRKTFLALAIAAHAVKNEHARVLFVSPEMPTEQVMNRFVATFAELPYTEFKNGNMPAADEERLYRVAADYGDTEVSKGHNDEKYQLELHRRLAHIPKQANPGFFVVSGANRPVSFVESQIEMLRPDIVIIDSFYRLSPENVAKKRDADWKIITAISRAVKDLAMTSKVAIICTHQLNRDAEGKVASMANLALADAIGQDADLVLQVFTRKAAGGDESALAVMGGRETACLGVVVKNVPCSDFSEVGPITDQKLLLEFYNAQTDEDEDEYAEDDDSEEAQKWRAAKRRENDALKTQGRKETARSSALKQADKLKSTRKKNAPPKAHFSAFDTSGDL